MEEAQRKSDEAKRERLLNPFKSDIASIVQTWENLNPASSSNMRMGVGSKKHSIRTFLETNLLDCGALPTGKHQLSDQWNNKFEVDFTVLKELASGLKKK